MINRAAKAVAIHLHAGSRARPEASQPNVAANTGVSLCLKTGTGTLSGTLTGTILSFSGSVTISGVTYSKAESGVVLTATRRSGDNLTAGDSAPFTVNVGAASQLAFTQQPGGSSVTGGVLPTQPKVTVQDTGGNTVTGSSASIVLSITSGTGTAGATLICSGTGTNGTTFTASSGVATATGCKIDKAGTGYKLHATSGTLTAADSSVFNVATADTTTTITNSVALATSSVVGSAYAVNYSVTVNPPGGGTPTGNVTVSDGTASCVGTVAAGTCGLTSTTVAKH